jgi:hypothetical protein
MEMVAVENGYSNDKGIDGCATACATYCSSGRQDGDMLPHNDCGYPRYSTYCTSVLESNTVPYSEVVFVGGERRPACIDCRTVFILVLKLTLQHLGVGMALTYFVHLQFLPE